MNSPVVKLLDTGSSYGIILVNSSGKIIIVKRLTGRHEIHSREVYPVRESID